MSANLWDESTANYKPDADGTYTSPAVGKTELGSFPSATPLAENQTIHMAASLMGNDVGYVRPFVKYEDAAHNVNYVGFPNWTPSATWQRFEGSVVVPSGMTVTKVGFNNAYATGEIKVSNPVFSYGSPVTLASSAHTPYATQDHVSTVYATKASLKVTDDSIKAEVSARAQTDQNVADLSSRLTQTENSLTSEISDRRTAITTVTGLANAAQSTADNAAKQANLYTIGLGDAGAVQKWIHLGTLTSADDASCAIISVYSGNGFNARPSQNSKLTITIKDGWQSTSSAVNACGVTVMRENCDNALVDVLAQSETVYDVWVYAPWLYSEGMYSISGNYAAWQHSGATQKDEPATSDTQVKQDVAYRIADATKAQTMALENKSSITQLSDSIKSLVKGESTYTDPDGKSATSGIYSLVTQTRDSVTALFGQYTKTADLASTQAVKDAKKAGTDAQAAASAAQSTADSLATMIREDATGITVGKSADGQTYSTGRTHMDEDSFDILDKAGTVITQLAGDGASFLSGLVRIVAGKVSLPGADSVDSITIDAGGGVATVSGLISRLSGLYNGISSTVTAGFATYGGNGITATVRDTESDIVANATLGVDKATVGIGGQYVKMKGDAFELSNPEYLLSALMDTRKVPGSLDTCGPGVFSYNGSTANRPTDYGVCLSFVAGSGDWLFQLALPTMGDPLWRRNINGAGWEGWWTITSQ